MVLKWDNLNQQSRTQILQNACLQPKFAQFKWNEIEDWIRFMIKDNLEVRSKKTVSID